MPSLWQKFLLSVSAERAGFSTVFCKVKRTYCSVSYRKTVIKFIQSSEIIRKRNFVKVKAILTPTVHVTLLPQKLAFGTHYSPPIMGLANRESIELYKPILYYFMDEETSEVVHWWENQNTESTNKTICQSTNWSLHKYKYTLTNCLLQFLFINYVQWTELTTKYC